jgi:hypothetical protein
MKGDVVIVNDKMQQEYRYVLSESPSRNFGEGFEPELTPAQMLALGIFGGKYMTDCQAEFPKEWFAHAKLSPRGRDVSLNFFKVDAGQPLSVWRSKGSYTKIIRAAGFSGIAATSWVAACRAKTYTKSSAGGRCGVTFGKSRRIASAAISAAGSGRRFCNGRMTAKGSETVCDSLSGDKPDATVRQSRPIPSQQ